MKLEIGDIVIWDSEDEVGVVLGYTNTCDCGEEHIVVFFSDYSDGFYNCTYDFPISDAELTKIAETDIDATVKKLYIKKKQREDEEEGYF